MAYLELSHNANYAIPTWYYQWDHTQFKIGIVDNANFEMCVIPLVIPSQWLSENGIFGIVT